MSSSKISNQPSGPKSTSSRPPSPTQNEIDAVRVPIETSKISGLQRLGGFGGIADTLAQYDQYTGDPGYLKQDLARGAKTTPAAVQAAAQKFLAKNASVVVYCTPGPKVDAGRPALAGTQPTPTLKSRPPIHPTSNRPRAGARQRRRPGRPRSSTSLSRRGSRCRTGLEVLFVPQHDLPVFTASVVTRAGGETNPVAQPGLASFTGAMITEGSELRPAQQQAQQGQRIGGELFTYTSMDAAITGLSVLSNQTAAAFDLLADAVQHPAFREEDVDRIRRAAPGLDPAGVRQPLRDRLPRGAHGALRKRALRHSALGHGRPASRASRGRTCCTSATRTTDRRTPRCC